MKNREVPVISIRKRPQQVRSTRLVADIKEAAARVLARDGARKFTTARVAEVAGVSVGSLYQYYPNKEAILFQLQTDEWERTGALLDGILANSQEPPPERLRSMVRAFFQSEFEEASLRTALEDAASLYRDAPEVRKHRMIGTRRAAAFMTEALPQVPVDERRLAGAVLMTTMSAVGKSISVQAHSQSEVDTWAQALGEMFCAYLQWLAERKRSEKCGRTGD